MSTVAAAAASAPTAAAVAAAAKQSSMWGIMCVIGSSLKYWQAIYGIDLKTYSIDFHLVVWVAWKTNRTLKHRFRTNEQTDLTESVEEKPIGSQNRFAAASRFPHTHKKHSKPIISWKIYGWMPIDRCIANYKALDSSNFRNISNAKSLFDSRILRCGFFLLSLLRARAQKIQYYWLEINSLSCLPTLFTKKNSANKHANAHQERQEGKKSRFGFPFLVRFDFLYRTIFCLPGK